MKERLLAITPSSQDVTHVNLGGHRKGTSPRMQGTLCATARSQCHREPSFPDLVLIVPKPPNEPRQPQQLHRGEHSSAACLPRPHLIAGSDVSLAILAGGPEDMNPHPPGEPESCTWIISQNLPVVKTASKAQAFPNRPLQATRSGPPASATPSGRA